MAKKTRLYKVRVRTAQDGEFTLNKPIPGASKIHVFNEINSINMAVLHIEYLYWSDIQLIGYDPSDYHFEVKTKNGYEFSYFQGDFGWEHLNYQSQQDVSEMIDYMEREQGYYDY